jgi:hypothetical protein
MSMTEADSNLSRAAAITCIVGCFAVACGPTLYPSMPVRELSTGEETAQSASEATRSEIDDDQKTVIYASSGAGGSPPLPTATPDSPESGPDASPDTETEQTDSEPPETSPPQTYLLERRNGRVTVQHGPYPENKALSAFDAAVRAVPSPAARPGETPEEGESESGQPVRLQLDELAMVDDSRVEIRGSAASEDDIEAYASRLEQLEAFSKVEVAATEPVTEGQGLRFRIAADYTSEG